MKYLNPTQLKRIEAKKKQLNQGRPLSPALVKKLREELNLLMTYNSNCYRSTAVMIGAAMESIIFEIRDKYIDKLNQLEIPIPQGLKDWKIKTVFDTLTIEFEKKEHTMPRTLKDKFNSYWQGFMEQIRKYRNDAGHPNSIEPITEEIAHSSFLIFPEQAILAYELMEWFQNTKI